MNVYETFGLNPDSNIFSYNEFIHWVEGLVSSGKTSGSKQPKELVNFTKLNLKRMQRIAKTTQIKNHLGEVLSANVIPQYWTVITEAWCGDSAQILPVLNKITEFSQGKIKLNIVFRDQNPELMEKYHTNGSKSIPKLIAVDSFGNELFTWGPRPKPAQAILDEWKKNPQGRSWDDFERELHSWYAHDKTLTIQKEFGEILAQQYRNQLLAA